METSLEPAKGHQGKLETLLRQVEASGVIDVDARKEIAHIRQDAGHRFAVLGANRSVVGYVTGRFSGDAPGITLPTTAKAAFISLLLIAPESQGAGHGRRAVLTFAHKARAASGATHIGLRLDETEPVEPRRLKFVRMGFEFADAGPYGWAAISDL